jgi:hypothetical protein
MLVQGKTFVKDHKGNYYDMSKLVAVKTTPDKDQCMLRLQSTDVPETPIINMSADSFMDELQEKIVAINNHPQNGFNILDVTA